MVSSLSRNSRDMGSIPTLGTIFPIFITHNTRSRGHSHVQATWCMVVEPTLCNGYVIVSIKLYIIVSIKRLRILVQMVGGTSVVDFTNVSGKKPHRQVGVGILVISRSLGGEMVITLHARDVGSIPILGTIFPIFITNNNSA